MSAPFQSTTDAQKNSPSPNPKPSPQRGARQLRVLVVEDDPPVREACLEVACAMGFVTASADSIVSAHQALTQPVDIVLLDLKLPGGNGLSLLDELQTRHPSAVIIIMTAYATVDSAVEALRVGAGDYLAKPFTLEDLSATLERAAERRTFDVEARELRERLRTGRGQGKLIGRAPGMEKLYRILSKVAYTTHPVLILGEPGTGKGVVARAIHLNGPRAAEPFATIECSTLTAAAIETQLFGAAKQPALLAQPGTLFLEEVGDLTLDLQAKLLRAFESRQFRSPNSAQPLPVAARLLASSSRDLPQLVETGRFRKDLFYRLNVVNLRLPPLRERKEDIPLLVASAVQRLHADQAPYSIAQDALRLLLEYDWPGNVQELNHAIERAFALTSGPVLHLGDFPTQLQNAERELRQIAAEASAPALPALTVEVRSIADMEKQAILTTLRQLNGDKLTAARLLGIGKTTLYRKLKEYGVSDADLQRPV
jgi:two-component system response regulator HydG